MRPLVTAFTSLLMFVCSGQLTWQRTYGAFSTEAGQSVIETSDGEYVVVGSTGSFGAGGGDVYVLRIAPDGERIWSRTLGGPGVDQGMQVKQAADGGLVVVGFTNSSGAGGYDGYFAKLDMSGAIAWERTYGGTGWDFLYSVVEHPEGGFVVAGETFSQGSGASDAWLVRVNDQGDLGWERQYGDTGQDFARSVTNCAAGGFLLGGAFTSEDDQDGWLIRTDINGDTLWTSRQGGDSTDYFNAAIETSDGGFAAVGTTNSYAMVTEAFHVKVDNMGGLVWQWNWGQVNDQQTFDVKELPDGRFLSTGYVTSGGSGGKDMFIFFTQANGDFQRGVSNGGDNGQGDEVGNSVALTQDGGSIHCGSTTSFGAGPEDVYVVKTNDTGWTATSAVVEEFDPIGMVDRTPVPKPTVFPNPTSLACRLTSRSRLLSAVLLDTQGRHVRSWTEPIPQELDLQGLLPGSYELSTVDERNVRSGLPLVIIAD